MKHTLLIITALMLVIGCGGSTVETSAMIGSIIGLITNIFLQVLLYRWLAIKLLLNDNKEKFEEYKVAYYIVFVIIAVVVFVFLTNAILN